MVYCRYFTFPSENNFFKNDGVLLQMATSTETIQSLDHKITTIKEVLERKISPSDEQSLRRMLMAAMQEKQLLMQSELSSLQAKYGIRSNQENMIVIDSPPPYQVRQTTPRQAKEAMAALKKCKRTEWEEDPDFEITPPPTKKKLSLGRKKTVITLPDSKEDEDELPDPEPRKTPVRGKGTGKGKGPAKRTPPPPPPSPSPTQASDSDSPAPILKKSKCE